MQDDAALVAEGSVVPEYRVIMGQSFLFALPRFERLSTFRTAEKIRFYERHKAGLWPALRVYTGDNAVCAQRPVRIKCASVHIAPVFL